MSISRMDDNSIIPHKNTTTINFFSSFRLLKRLGVSTLRHIIKDIGTSTPQGVGGRALMLLRGLETQ